MRRYCYLACALAVVSVSQAASPIDAGKQLYFESGGYGCAVCHGLVAEGGGQAGGWIRGATLDMLNDSLANNEPMKPLASVLSDHDRQQLVHYLQQLQQIPLVQLQFENGQWTGTSEPLIEQQTAEIVLYNATFEEQSIDLTALGLGVRTLAPLARDSGQWQVSQSPVPIPFDIEITNPGPAE